MGSALHWCSPVRRSGAGRERADPGRRRCGCAPGHRRRLIHAANFKTPISQGKAGMPGFRWGIARTAITSGTATAVSNSVSRQQGLTTTGQPMGSTGEQPRTTADSRRAGRPAPFGRRPGRSAHAARRPGHQGITHRRRVCLAKATNFGLGQYRMAVTGARALQAT